ncbi:MAG: 4Fe-4S binding protein [Clostridiales Family XIII bacterium]|jgi:formate hydrogenlyase subunit 6/NADH:ubiquinone oxidoreductase subunit I|nr:4Fe-4S binding protein [Clostridiales Family XIII bacterium]
MAILKIGKMVMGSLFRKPATLMYPVVPRKWQERTRGHIEIVIEDCILCGICAKKCPTDAITVAKDTKSWTIRRMQCIQCSCCVEVCPKKCLDNKNEYTIPSAEKLVDSFEKPAAEPAAAGAGAAAAAPAAAPADGTLKCADTCIYCGICAKKCPQDALTVSRKKKNAQTGEQEGENIWSVNAETCILCGICVEACPKKSLAIE